MNLRPLKDRVLILPEAPSDTTPSGLILAEHRKPEQTDFGGLPDLIRELVNHQSAVAVGDYVVFSWTAGQEVWVEDGQERYLLMRESDILAVVEDDE